MENPVLIFGANYLGRVAKEIFESNGHVVYGFLDDSKEMHAKEIDEATVLGSSDDDGFLKLIGKKCEAFVAVDDTKVRMSLVKMLNEVRHVQPVNAIHKLTFISKYSEMGHGNLIDQGVRVAAGTVVKNYTIIQAGAILGTGASLGDYVQIGIGSIINAGVTIEDEAFIGSGVTIVSGITVGKGARVGAGSVVIAPVKAGETIFGNPAQSVKA